MIKIKKIIIILFLFFLNSNEVKAQISDGIFVVVGDKAITKLDIVDEIKLILILNNMSYSDEKRQELQDVAIKSSIKRVIKKIEIEKNDFLEFSPEDYNNELIRIATRINVDVDTLRNICISNGLDFKIVENQIKTELLWNSLIFHLYKNRLTVNLTEIDEQLSINQDKKEFDEFLISEIVIEKVEQDMLKSTIDELRNKIELENFENVAVSLSISQTASRGGDLGWLSENEIASKFRSKILNTPIGSVSEPIFLNNGILFFKVRDRRKKEKEVSLEELKEQLVRSEKTKILNMYSLSHYDNLRRSIAIKFFNE